MGPIVCATRGGEAGRRTQERAIDLAREQGRALVFLAVFDPCSVGHLNDDLSRAVEQEQRWLGRALLGIARARARRRGVTARSVVRCGPVLETIEAYLKEVDAAVLIIGEPKVDSALAAFQPGRVQQFAEQIGQDTGVEVVVVTPEPWFTELPGR
jgi:nucleotide-binding universal stress UspA family protein